MCQCMYTSIHSIVCTHIRASSSSSYLLCDFLAGCNLENEKQLLICVVDTVSDAIMNMFQFKLLLIDEFVDSLINESIQ